jgi:transposase
MDLFFELATQIVAQLDEAVSPVDEVHGFRYFDDRDLIGFVDGTENPTGQAAIDAAYVGVEDAVFAGGSYVLVQKYLHDMAGWNALSTEAQERIIGRTKLSDIELDDTVKPTSAHSALTTIVEDGKEIKIIPRQHAVRQGCRERVRHLFYWLRALAANDRANVGKYVRRPSSRQLRSFARFQLRYDCGCRWCDCPPEYGPPTTIYNRFVRWARRGVWENLFRELAGNGRSKNTQMIDSTHIKAHRSAAGGKGGSRSRLLAARAEGETRRFMHSQMLRDDLSPSC